MTAPVKFPGSSPADSGCGASPRTAILLSAAVCPGAGHFSRRRWLAGALFMGAFAACLVMVLLAVVAPLAANLRIALDLAERGSAAPLRAVSLARLLIWFGLALLVYVAALADLAAHARRQARRRLDERRKNLEARLNPGQ